MNIPYRPCFLPEALFPLHYASPEPNELQEKRFFTHTSVQETLKILRETLYGSGLKEDFPSLPQKMRRSLLGRMLLHARTVAIVHEGMRTNETSAKLEQALLFLETKDYESFVLHEYWSAWRQYEGWVNQCMSKPNWRQTMSEYLGGQKFSLGVNVSALVRRMVLIHQQTGPLKLSGR